MQRNGTDIENAQEALARGDWPTAAEAFEALLDQRPEQPDLSFKLARAYEEMGRHEDAIALLSRPHLSGLNQTKRMLASSYMNFKDFRKALPLVEDLLESSPDDPKLAKWKARCEEKIIGRRLAEGLKDAKALASEDHFEKAEQAYLELRAAFPTAAEPHWRLAQMYLLEKRWADAVPLFHTSLSLDADNADIKTSLARALFKSGQSEEAVAVLERLDESFKGRDELFLQQRCYTELRDWRRAAEVGQRFLAKVPADDPLHADSSIMRQDALARLEHEQVGPFEEGDEAAVARYQQIADRYPLSAFALLKVGKALSAVGRHAEAAAPLRRAFAAEPEDIAIRAALTRAVLNSSGEQEMLAYVEEAIAAGTADAECYRWLARFSAEHGDWQSTLDNLEQALMLEPGNAPTLVRKTWALFHLGRLPEVLEELELVLPLGEKSGEMHQLKADILLQLGQLEEAVRFYELALQKSPKEPLISFKLSQALLLKGDIEGFHRLYERRREVPAFVENDPDPPFEAWDGELSISGKLLIWVEARFGVGGTLLHLAFIDPLVRLGLDVVLEVAAPLTGICRRSFPAIDVVESGRDRPSEISHHSPLGSLSRWFKPDLESFASPRPYLVPDREAVAAERLRVKANADEGDLLVGTMGSDASANASALQEAIAVPGVTLIDLDTAEVDLDRLSARVAAMDLVVGCDHPIAHLAGALGVPSHIVLPAVPDAHWLAQGDRAIWYPGTRLFRRAPIDQDWTAVIVRVGDAVREFAKGYEADSWLSGTLVPTLQPVSARPAAMSAMEIRNAVSAFIIQGWVSQTAYQSALELIDRLTAEERTQTVEMQRGELFARFGDWEEARAIYAGLLLDDAGNRELMDKVLSISLAMYDLERALPMARQLAMQEVSYRIVAANILYQMRRPDEALGELRMASSADPQVNGLSTLLGTILLETGDLERAEAYLSTQAALSRRPEDYALLARVIAGQGRHEESLGLFRKALEQPGADPAAHYWHGRARIELGMAEPIPLSPVFGSVPNVGRDDVVLFFAADSSFFWEHGLVLLGSVSKRSPRANCHVHIVNPDESVSAALEAIREASPELNVTYSHEQANFDGCSDDFVRTYYASVRFVRLAEIFARSPATYLCVDADCIIRRDLADHVAGLDVGDVGIRKRFSERRHATVAAGALLLRPTGGGTAFIERVSGLIRAALEAREAVWFLDQIVLSQVVRELGDAEVRVGQLEMSYIDWFFRGDSLIWTGKGRRKAVDTRYANEVSQYDYFRRDKRVASLSPDTSGEDHG